MPREGVCSKKKKKEGGVSISKLLLEDQIYLKYAAQSYCFKASMHTKDDYFEIKQYVVKRSIFDLQEKKQQRPFLLHYFETEQKVLQSLRKKFRKKGSCSYFVQFIASETESSKQKTKQSQSQSDKITKGTIVMRYYPNGNLLQYWERRKRSNQPLTCREIFFIAQELITAFFYFHQGKYMHRNLRLEKVLFDENFNIKICDFKFAMFHSGKANEYVKNLPFSAPQMELLSKPNLDKSKYTNKIDIYSVGVLIYFLLFESIEVKKKAYENEQAKTRIKEQIKKLNKEIEEQKKEIIFLQYLATVLLPKMLDEDPDKRASAEELLNLGSRQLKKAEKGKFKKQRKLSKDQILKTSDFKWLSKHQRYCIQRQLRQKKTLKKVQVKKVFHLSKVGYCIVLSNRRTYLASEMIIKKRREIIVIELQKDFKQKFNEACECPDEKNEIYLLFDRLVSRQYCQFMERWRRESSIDDYVGDKTALAAINKLRDDVLIIRLSNGVIQFLFGDCRVLQNDDMVFQRGCSLNYHKINPRKMQFFDDISSDEGRLQFQDYKLALKNEQTKGYVEYVRQVLWLLSSQKQKQLQNLNVIRDIEM